MIIKKYKVKVITSEYKSDLREEVNPPFSDVYLMKEQDWLKYSIEINDELKPLCVPLIHERKVYKEYVEFSLNSLNFFFTNVQKNGKYYKYIVKSNKPLLTLKEAKTLLQDYSIVEINSKYYTNTLGYYKSSDTILFTENVINVDDCLVTYKSKHITIRTPKDCIAIPNDTILTPQFINEYSVYIPSFFLKTDTYIKCVDSNLLPKKVTMEDRLYHPQYRIISNTDNTSSALNMVLKQDDITLQYSTHILPITGNRTTFFIEPNGHITEEQSSSNLSFTVTKNVDLTKVKFIPNNYKHLSNDINEKEYLKNRVYSYIEVDPGINSTFDSYLQIHNTYPEYIYIYKDNTNLIKITPRRVEENPDLSFLDVLEPKEVSCNRVPCHFVEDSSKKIKIKDGVSYVH